MNALIDIILLTFIILSLYWFIRRSKYLAWVTLVILPLTVIPLLISQNQYDLFQWIKMYSVILGVGVILLYKSSKKIPAKWLKHTIYLVFALNIAEAVIVDFLQNSMINYINAITGIILILTLTSATSLHVTKKNGLLWDGMTFFWIIGYTLWNMGFVYLNYPGLFAIHTTILIVALYYGFYYPGTWLQARAFTLATYFVVLTFLLTYTNITPLLTMTKNNSVAAIIVLTSFIYSIKLLAEQNKTNSQKSFLTQKIKEYF